MDNAEFEIRIAAPMRAIEEARANLEAHRPKLQALTHTYPIICQMLNKAHDELVADVFRVYFQSHVGPIPDSK